MVSLEEVLKNKLNETELKLIPKSFDIIGSKEKAVAIVEIPEELKQKEKLIAEAIMKLNKNVKSVLKKVSERKGELRLREYELLAGDVNTEVIHKEYGYLLKLDPQKVYFSPREATERQRIASQVKENETVLVMFSGIAPFAIAIAKKQPEVKKVYAIELNDIAHQYAIENVRINKLGHKIVLILGDVREVCKKYYEKFDRIVMPLPLGAENFLDVAIACLKENGIIHFYSWGKEPDLFSNALKLIEENCKKLNKKFEILSKRKVLPYKPRTYKICIEFKVQG
jgi:tRNA (guanine37-N1)-methyltransferase